MEVIVRELLSHNNSGPQHVPCRNATYPPDFTRVHVEDCPTKGVRLSYSEHIASKRFFRYARDMRYQYKREPLTQDEANRLANACQTHEEKLVIWTLLDTGLRVAELANLTKDNLDWQNHRLMIYGGSPGIPVKTEHRFSNSRS
jgi:integrase